ncbi:MmgE/PrpD family protein [Thermoplasma sp.]|uniref:MmgE/PrpD family protein n=1 Tax=Thermoplasma sp. TaxID=1973142 RepID=UPI0012876E4B|nr:MmgE/PrpD family protein [Thermoplasma sp.]KAA8922872.1 MAG: MmgE/PrpD family protein [Thermoplasma sp.]
MDSVVKEIKNYADGVSYSRMTEEEKEALKMRIADSIITAYTARSSPPVNALLDVLGDVSSKTATPLYFKDRKIFSPYAVLINGCMTRYMDYNDTYLSKEALHPSDNVPPILAAAQMAEADGKDILRGLKIAYDVVCSLADAVSIRDRGWDHVNYDSISSSAGIASIFDLDDEKFENAISLGIINNVSMRQTRAGKLSMWKGCTVAYQTMSSLLAAMNARSGLTGPSEIFDGEMGFKKQVSGPFDLRISPHVLKTMIKNYPVEYHAMSAAQAASQIRNKIKGKIKSISVDTFRVAHTIIVKDPEKLRPENKETADHSMPYIIAYTLLYGEPDVNSYDARYLKDEKILDLIDRMKFNVTKKFDDMYPEYLPVKIQIEDDEGKKDIEIDVPKGHFKDPYTWSDLMNKAERVDPKIADVVKELRNLDRMHAGEIFEVINRVKA